MKVDKLIQKIFSDSEKAELLEAITEKLPDCDRMIVCCETRNLERPETSTFEYFQLGFKQTYEILGFLGWLGQMITEEDKIEQDDNIHQ